MECIYLFSKGCDEYLQSYCTFGRISALKSVPVLVLDPSGLEPGTEPVLIISNSYELQTGPEGTGSIRSLPVLRPVLIGSEPDLVPPVIIVCVPTVNY
jgi:hypothetical protein